MYRPPDSKVHLSTGLKILLIMCHSKGKKIILLGDFNKSLLDEHKDIEWEYFVTSLGSRKTSLDKLPTMYWLAKLHKRPYKARFIANSSFCTTTELCKLLTSCLTAVKSRVIRYYETAFERSRKNMFWSIKILARYLVN